MVEFGLKLEDNKVLRWSEHYIDYEKLKAVLAKCKAAQQRLDELMQRKPELAATLLKNKSTTETADTDTATPMEEVVEEEATTEEEETQVPVKYGSTDAVVPKKEEEEDSTTTEQQQQQESRLNRVDSKGKLFLLGLSKTMRISEFFIRNYEKSLREAARDKEATADEFQRVLEENVERVLAFAHKKLAELHGRLDHLRDSASILKLIERSAAAAAGRRNTLRSSMAGSRIWSAFASVVIPTTTSSMAQQQRADYTDDEAPLLRNNAMREDDDAQADAGVLAAQTKSESERMREAESIQRALEDSYRSAKLLQNFCIMNYTGFVKIIKKHDKLIKSRKGKLKVTEADFPNTDLDELTTTMEKLYANWFCDRNVAEARAQMLTKRGDGLEMDWSQLRLGYRMGMVCTVVWYLLHSHGSTLFCCSVQYWACGFVGIVSGEW